MLEALSVLDLNVPNPAPDAPDTTIVLATCNRAALLHGALASLLAQDWISRHPVEFVFVDDGSGDETPRLLREFQVRAQAEHRVAVRVLEGQRAGIAAARNLGFRAARGRWIASFDDDQCAAPGWLSALRHRAEFSRAVCVGGALTLLLPDGVEPGSLGPRTRAVLGEHGLEAQPRPYRGGNDLPATNNALLRQDVFAATGPFDTRFTEGGEDKDLFRRVQAAGYAVWLEPAAQAGHVTPPGRLAPANIRWTCLRLGASDARGRLAYGRLPGAFRLALVRLAVALLRDTPALLWAGFRQDGSARTEARCSLWYTQGVLRSLPELFRQEPGGGAFLRSLDFRQRNGERTEATRPAHAAD